MKQGMNFEQDKQELEEIIRKIEMDSEQIPVPESLSPENIKNRILQKKKKSMRYFMEIAAAIVLVVTLGGAGVYRMIGKDAGLSEKISTQNSSNSVTDVKPSLIGDTGHIEKIGKYHLAKDYNEVYEAVDEYRQEQKKYIDMDTAENTTNDVSFGMEDAVPEAEKQSSNDFSKTNTQVEGIDESDFVKNDFDYLFVQEDAKVTIIDIREEKMKSIATIEPKLQDNDTICDMYMDGNRVVLIIEQLTEKRNHQFFSSIYSAHDCIMLPMDAKVMMQTYDITDRKNPKLVGNVTVDGHYKESRKDDDVVFVFTSKWISDIGEDDREDLIPCINGTRVEPDSIYVGDCIDNELIAASVDLKEPNRVLDQVVVMSSYSNIYMGNNAIYLYENTYKNEVEKTEITRFNHIGGYFGNGSAVSVAGRITDQFAISEGDGIVRVLTSVWDHGKRSNELHLYDYAMNELGNITGIAEGEEIYAARYFNDLAYFITYRNIDPLFAVDISDPENPQMLGELEVTGFSDYLHPYGENLLLGIGYETDPETLEQIGLKLTMFDISNPTNLKVLDSVVIEKASSPATYLYKSILADAKKNLIGFGVELWNGDTSGSYLVYRWIDGQFVNVLSEKIKSSDCFVWDNARGCYAGMRFYCVYKDNNTYHVKSYDVEQNFKNLDEIIL